MSILALSDDVISIAVSSLRDCLSTCTRSQSATAAVATTAAATTVAVVRCIGQPVFVQMLS
jgi:hypothetical protein